MEFRIINQVNSRWADGRPFSAMPGRVVTVDDTDLDAVAHMRYLVGTGDAVEVEAAAAEPTKAELQEELREAGLPVSGTKAELQERLAEAEVADDDPPPPDAPKPAKKATAKAASDE